MNILVLGSGGREHALAWKLAQSPLADKVICAPGNPGTSHNTPVSLNDPAACLAIAESLDADLTVVGPEAPLVAGVVDAFRTAGRNIVGPTAAAAQLEGSKAFSKAFLLRHKIPTARALTASDAPQALKLLDAFGYPVVLKADGLAAGKGVIIAQDRAQAVEALQTLPQGRILIEEFLRGEEVSFIVLVTPTALLPLAATQDHKAVHDNDTGPNTGGMGAYCDGRILNLGKTIHILEKIIQPTIEGMKADGIPYTGFLYAGLMITRDGPKVLEYNCRLGDPEAQPLLHRMISDLPSAFLDNEPFAYSPDPSVCVVLAAHGYPAATRTGDVITGLDSCPADVFQAGTRAHNGQLLTAGGRVLGVTASGPDLPSAIANTYAAIPHIQFDGMHYRNDIGAKGLKRW